jgi:hypothetical protein
MLYRSVFDQAGEGSHDRTIGGFGLVPIGSTQAEHGEQGGVHAPLLFGCQMTG